MTLAWIKRTIIYPAQGQQQGLTEAGDVRVGLGQERFHLDYQERREGREGGLVGLAGLTGAQPSQQQGAVPH